MKIKTGDVQTRIEKDKGAVVITEGDKQTIIEIAYENGLKTKTIVDGKTAEKYYPFVCRKVFDKTLSEMSQIKDDQTLTQFINGYSSLLGLFNLIEEYLKACM